MVNSSRKSPEQDADAMQQGEKVAPGNREHKTMLNKKKAIKQEKHEKGACCRGNSAQTKQAEMR